MKTPRQTRSAVSTDKMIDAVLALAAEGGLDNVTIEKVAKQAGVSNGAIFHRFKSRDDLLLAASDRLMSGIEARMEAILADLEGVAPSKEALAQFVSAHMAVFEDNLAVLRAFMVGAIGVPVLQTRGNRAARRVSEGFSAWLRATFGTEAATEAAIYRLMFASGTVLVIFPGNLTFGETSVTQDDVLAELIDTIWLVLSAHARAS